MRDDFDIQATTRTRVRRPAGTEPPPPRNVAPRWREHSNVGKANREKPVFLDKKGIIIILLSVSLAGWIVGMPLGVYLSRVM